MLGNVGGILSHACPHTAVLVRIGIFPTMQDGLRAALRRIGTGGGASPSDFRGVRLMPRVCHRLNYLVAQAFRPSDLRRDDAERYAMGCSGAAG